MAWAIPPDHSPTRKSLKRRLTQTGTMCPRPPFLPLKVEESYSPCNSRCEPFLVDLRADFLGEVEMKIVSELPPCSFSISSISCWWARNRASLPSWQQFGLPAHRSSRFRSAGRLPDVTKSSRCWYGSQSPAQQDDSIDNSIAALEGFIVVVQHRPDVARRVESALTHAGATVLVVNTAAESIAIMNRYQAHLVVVDTHDGGRPLQRACRLRSVSPGKRAHLLQRDVPRDGLMTWARWVDIREPVAAVVDQAMEWRRRMKE